MKYFLSVKQEADKEAVESFVWYEKQREGLGKEFLVQVEKCLNAISSSPLHYQKIYKQYRHIPVRRFPFVIIFEIEGNSVVVYSVFHTSRNPNKKFKKIKLNK